MKLLSGVRRRYRSRAAAMLAGAGAVLVGTGCSIEAPSSDTSTNFVLSVPIADDSTRVESLVGDRSDFLEIDRNTGGMKLRVTIPLPGDDPAAEPRILGSATVGDNLKITPRSSRFSTAIGDLSIPGQTIPEITVGLGTLLGRDIAAGTTVPALPAIDFDTEVPLDLANVSSLTIGSGGLDVAVANDLPIAIENLSLGLVDQANGALVDRIDLGTLTANGGTAAGSFDLAGRTISGNLKVTVTGGTRQVTSVLVGANAELRINSQLQTLVVSQATAVIPEQEFADRQVLEFPDDRIQVTEAAMRSGGITLVVTNNIPIVMEVELTLPDLLDARGDPQRFLIDSLFAGQPRTVSFDLTDNVFKPADPLEMRIEYRAKTFDSDTEVTITSDGTIEVQALTQELVFSRVQGRLNQVELAIPEQRRSVQFPSGLDNVNIADVNLAVHVTSGVGFLADVSLLFTGVNDRGDTGTLMVQETFERGDPQAPRSDTLTVNSAALTDFINLLPTTITVAPVIVVGDGQEEEVVESTDFVTVDSVVFGTEPRLSILQDTRIDPDVQDASFRDSDTRDKIATNFVDARVVTEIESSIPVGVGVRLYAAHSRADVYTNPSITVPPLDEPPFQVAAAPVDAGGLSSGSVAQADTIDLVREEVLEFVLDDCRSGPAPPSGVCPGGLDSLFTGVRVTLPRTDGVVEVRATDFVNVVAGLRLELRLDDNLVK